VQHDLFDLGGELSVPGHAIMTEAHSTRLEVALDALNADLPPLKDFILPGGSRAASLTHVARTVCRRAERSLATLAATETLAPPLLQYVNRLSDLLFVMARALNRDAGRSDIYWQQGKNRI
jgi:cob(I)alamin adenosyltransferase